MINTIRRPYGIQCSYPEKLRLKVGDLLLIHSRTSILSSTQQRELQYFNEDTIFEVVNAGYEEFYVKCTITNKVLKNRFIQRATGSVSSYNFYVNYAFIVNKAKTTIKELEVN